MNRKKSLLTICVFAMLFIFVSNTVARPCVYNNSEKSTDDYDIIVDDDGDADFTNIQDAVKAAEPGDKILVKAGTYTDTVLYIKKPLELIGEDKEKVFFMRENKNGGVIEIDDTSNVRVSGFTFDGLFQICIQEGSYEIEISNNNIYRSSYCGVSLLGTDNNKIINNKFIETNSINCIKISRDANNNTISNNIIEYPEPYVTTAIDLIFGSSNNTISNNVISVDYLKVSSCMGAIDLTFDCDNNIISGNTILNFSDAVDILDSYNNEVSQNIITSCYKGIIISSSANEKILDNTIKLDSPSGVTTGVELSFSESCIISGNYIEGRGKDKHGDAVFLWSSPNNKIIGNDIKNHEYGVWLSEDGQTIDNYVYHNNFFENRMHGVDYHNPKAKDGNFWDNGYKKDGGGNYWDDYTGTDENNDNIGDDPYYVDGEGVKDNYPLIEPDARPNSKSSYMSTILQKLIDIFPILGSILQSILE